MDPIQQAQRWLDYQSLKKEVDAPTQVDPFAAMMAMSPPPQHTRRDASMSPADLHRRIETERERKLRDLINRRAVYATSYGAHATEGSGVYPLGELRRAGLNIELPKGQGLPFGLNLNDLSEEDAALLRRYAGVDE